VLAVGHPFGSSEKSKPDAKAPNGKEGKIGGRGATPPRPPSIPRATFFSPHGRLALAEDPLLAASEQSAYLDCRLRGLHLHFDEVPPSTARRIVRLP
jgi:hypothetical protein